jgi:hypothetical protein
VNKRYEVVLVHQVDPRAQLGEPREERGECPLRVDQVDDVGKPRVVVQALQLLTDQPSRLKASPVHTLYVRQGFPWCVASGTPRRRAG